MKTLLFLLCATSLHAVTFESWVATHGLTGTDALADADPDKDRLTNLAEYALHGLNPTTLLGHGITSFETEAFKLSAATNSLGVGESGLGWVSSRLVS